MVASVRPQALTPALNSGPPRPKTLRAVEPPSSSRDELAGLLAHDLKTPLSAIAMNLDYVLAELEALEPPREVSSALDDCRHANARAIRIVSDMADVARLTVGDYRPLPRDVDPADLLESAAQRAWEDATGRGLQVTWSADSGAITVDPDLMGRALDRLLERAVRHARPGSTLTIDYAGGAIAIAAQASANGSGRTEPVARALAVHFASAAVRAQGASLSVEVDGGGMLVFRIAL
jgi:two-component system, OmpR family, heavy metal sensor histidine kinase CusS